MPHKGFLIIYGRPAVCFRCRVIFKDISVCPHCQRPMVKVGLGFEVPPRNKVREWKRLALRFKTHIAENPEHYKVVLTHKNKEKPFYR